MTIKKRSIFLVGMILISAGMLLGQTHVYSEGYGDSGNQVGKGAATDQTGNSYLVGAYEGSINLGGGGLTSGGSDDIFLVKYDALTNHVWSKSFGGPDIQVGNAITVSPAGDIYIVGTFKNSIQFGGGNTLIECAGGNSAFLAKLNSSGDYIWGKCIGTTSDDTGTGVALDQNGNILVTGSLKDNITFASSFHPTFGSTDGFLAKFDGNGTEQWLVRVGGTSDDATNGVVIDGAGNNYIIGEFQGSGNFGGSIISSIGGYDIFVCRIDSTGTFDWENTYGNSSPAVGKGIGIDPWANIFLTGSIKDPVNFGGGGITSGGNDDIFLVQLDSLGNHNWSSAFGGSSLDLGTAIAVDGSGNVFLTGRFDVTADFGGGGITSGGSDDIFKAGFTNGGIHLFSGGYGGSNKECGYGIAVNSSDDLVLTGSMESGTNFGGGAISNSGGSDLFLFISNFSLILPTSFLDFQAKLVENNVSLQWGVEDPGESHSFSIERAKGSSMFLELNSIPLITSENNDLPSKFSYLDKKVAPGRYYYRIKSRDIDGRESFSKTVEVNVNMVPTGLLDVYTDLQGRKYILNILQDKEVKGTLKLINFQGKTIKEFSVHGGDHITIDFGDLPSSLYILRYEDHFYQSVIKVIKP